MNSEEPTKHAQEIIGFAELSLAPALNALKLVVSDLEDDILAYPDFATYTVMRYRNHSDEWEGRTVGVFTDDDG
jgi:hypothetical protein